MRFILEAWVSPTRKEDYYNNIILLDTTDDYWALDDVRELLDEFSQDNIFEEFHDKDNGLWKIVIQGTCSYRTDYWGESDIEYDWEVLFKSKCRNFKEIRDMWSVLRPTIQGEIC